MPFQVSEKETHSMLHVAEDEQDVIPKSFSSSQV